ncbi:MAG: hypothetical protein Q7U75_14785 [Desulfobacterales bacterium]|nr:hypothetical protein [Desulfobacterales bacterium]
MHGRRVRRDGGNVSDIVTILIILIPLVLVPYMFSLQFFRYYERQAATYSAAYFTLRAAETYYAGDLADPDVQAELADLYTRNVEDQGYPADGSTLQFENAASQYFVLRITQEVPIFYFPDSFAWSGEDTMPIVVELVGRKVLQPR